MSPEARDLVAHLMVDVLDSFEKLEVVVTLEACHEPMTAAALADRLNVGRGMVEEALEGLDRSNVIEKVTAGYLLDTKGPWAPHVRALVEMQRTDRMRVVTLMSSAALDRMRASARRAFADAFVIGSKKRGGEDG